MLRWIILAVIVVILTASATFLSLYLNDPETAPKYSARTAKGPQPKVEIDDPLLFDFGAMPQQSTGTHSWKIKNVGEGDLELWMESSTCSCTIAKLATKDGDSKKKVVVKPGDSTEIDLEWQTKTFHDAYSKGATIGTNDFSRQSFQLAVKGTVNPPVVVYPPEMIRFDAISNEEPNQAGIAVFSPDRPDMKITKVSSSRPEFIVATVVPFTEDDRKHLKVKEGGWRINVLVKPGLPVGSFQDELTIETDHPLQSLQKVSIAGRTTGPISVVPLGLRITDISSKKGGSGVLTMLVRGGRPTKFEVVQKPEKVEVKIEHSDTDTQKGRYLLQISVPAGTPPGQIDEMLIIKTDHPHASELKIPVNILITNVAGD
jgi:Protein of unknown function (DUF1573)